VRRVRDVSVPAAPVVLYINPQFAGDAFSQRRLRLLAPQQARRLPTGAGFISVDAQILLASNGAAASLTSQLAAAPLAAGVAQALQGSSLAGAQVVVSVQPFPAAGGSGAEVSPAASPLQQVSGAAGAGAAGGVLLLGVCAALYFRSVRRRDAVVSSASAAADTSAPIAAAAASAATGLPRDTTGGNSLPFKGAPSASSAPPGESVGAAETTAAAVAHAQAAKVQAHSEVPAHALPDLAAVAAHAPTLPGHAE
jgi:hypothetical protein